MTAAAPVRPARPSPLARAAAGLARAARRLAGREDAQATTEFVVIFPVFLVIFLSCFEASLLLIRQLMLERALDVVVRDVRISTGTLWRHDQLQAKVCERASILPDCRTNLVVEIVEIPRPTYDLPSAWTPCVDRTAVVQPFSVDSLIQNGAVNDLMLVRACYVIDPVFPGVGLGLELVRDNERGEIQMTAASAFVQEP